MLNFKNMHIFLKLILILALIILLIICCCNNNDNFTIPWNAKSQVPNIDNLNYVQLKPQSVLNNLKDNNLKDNNLNNAPNFDLNESKFKTMEKENIYRQKTGRQAYEIEYFVNKYDSNFGGLLGTQMGLNP